MKYNFDEKTNRRNTDSLKWDVKENELPMWVADMDFKTLPDIITSLKERINIGAFGYSNVNLEWKKSIINWWKYYNLEIEEDNLIFVNGVVSALSALVNRVTNIGDNILLITPTYNIFYNCIINHGRHVIECDLTYENYQYSLDYKVLEEKMKNPLTTAMILCNPQNPIGRIWNKDELEKIGSLAKKYGVVVISDEIHCDITIPGKKYIPFASVNEECKNNSITLVAPSKTFNLAGLNSACAIVFDYRLFNLTYRALNSYDIAEPNFFAIQACTTAYQKGRVWVDELREYINNNRLLVKEYLNNYIKDIKLVESDATYLLWLDCSKLTDNSLELQEFIRKTSGLYLSDGLEYHGNGKYFLRMNVGTQKENVIDGLNRLKLSIEEYKKC